MSEAEKIAAITLDFYNALEAAAVNAKKQIAELYAEADKHCPQPTKEPAAVLELTFNLLRFEAQKGVTLGDYEIAHKAGNLPDKWSSAYNILRNSSATIKERYQGETYQYSYWLYGEDKIYRQKPKPKTMEPQG
jgi:hypothetical protein